MTGPRIRTKSQTPIFTNCVRTKNGNLLASDYIQSTWSHEKYMSDIVTDRFNARIMAGEVINNGCEYRVESQELVGQSTVWWQNVADPFAVFAFDNGNATDWARWISSAGLSFTAPESADVGRSTLDAGAKSKALANVDSTPYEFFEDILELRETARFLKNPLEALKGVTKAFKRKKKKLLRKHALRDAKFKAKAVANLWTQYRFAASPLLRSITGAFDAYEDYQSGKIHRNARRSAHGKTEGSAQAAKSVNAFTAPGVYEKVFAFSCTQVVNESHHASILYEVSNPVADVNFALGLRAKDIPEVMWQIVPLSFMVDRVVNVSNFVRGVTNILDPTVSFLSGSHTRKTSTQEISTLSDYYFGSGVSIVHDLGKVDDYIVDSKFNYHRDTWAPSISDTVPPFTWGGLVEDITKIADLAAIILGHVK